MSPSVREGRARELERRCYAGLTAAELRAEVLVRLRAIMSVDAAFFASVDPATLLFTAAIQEAPLGDAGTAFLDNEFGDADVNKFAALAVAPDPARSLDDATAGDRAQSPRYREILAPLGLGDELRTVLRTDAATWGVMCLHREDGPLGFAPPEAQLLAAIAPHIAEGLRRAQLMEVTRPDVDSAPTGPGVVLLYPDLTLASLTPAAEELLAELADPTWCAEAAPPDNDRSLDHDARVVSPWRPGAHRRRGRALARRRYRARRLPRARVDGARS